MSQQDRHSLIWVSLITKAWMEIMAETKIRAVLMMNLASSVYTVIEWLGLLTAAPGTYQMRGQSGKDTHYNVTL